MQEKFFMSNKDYKGDVCSHNHSFLLDNFVRRFFQNPKKIVGEYVKEGDFAFTRRNHERFYYRRNKYDFDWRI